MSVADLYSSNIRATKINATVPQQGLDSARQRVSPHRYIAGLVILDAILLALPPLFPLAAAYLTGMGPIDLASASSSANGQLLILTLLVFPVFFLSQFSVGGYRTKDLAIGTRLVRKLALSLLIAFGTIYLVSHVYEAADPAHRTWLLVWTAISFVTLPLFRWMIVARLQYRLANGAYVHRALSVGINCPPLSQGDISRLSTGLSRTNEPQRLTSLDQLAALEADVRDYEIDEIYVSVSWKQAPDVLRELQALRHMAANVFVLPCDEAARNHVLRATLKGDHLHMQVVDRPIEGWASIQKRAADILGASLALLIAAPVLAIVALAIKLESPGPILFRQIRQGFNGRRFEVLKFRSMYHHCADQGAERQTSRRDSRVTRVGRVIRATSLDELPQIFNVLRGDMSIVGPRPHALQTKAEGKALEDAVSDYAARHRVKPGITGLAQVNGFRGELDTIEKLKNRVRLDIEYIDNWSLWLDAKIVLKTVLSIIRDRNAY